MIIYVVRVFLLDFFGSFICTYVTFFFFSSRRRHTICLSDWSSDVCSSDLHDLVRVDALVRLLVAEHLLDRFDDRGHARLTADEDDLVDVRGLQVRVLERRFRSEERRVGKGWMSWWWSCTDQDRGDMQVAID